MPTYKPIGDQRYKPKVDAWIEREVGFPRSGPSAVEALMDRTLSVRSETLPVNPTIVAEQLGCRVRFEDIPAARLEATPRGHGHRILFRGKQEGFEESGAPGSSFSFTLETSGRSIPFEEADHELAQEAVILRTGAVAKAAGIFAKHHVQDPVHTLN